MSTASLTHSELRRIAGPWVRGLRDGSARRHVVGRVVAYVVPWPLGGFSWGAGDQTGKAATREGAKARADHSLRLQGFVAVDVAGGCEIETEEPTKAPLCRVYREDR